MGQNNNCIQLKRNSYDVQEESILGMEGSNSTSKRSSRRPRLRSDFDVPAPLEKEGVILKQISTKRRISDPTANESHLPRKSVESFFARCAQVGRIRRPSLLTTLEGRKAPGTTSNRRSLSPSDGRRSGRTFWNFRSFSGRNKNDEQLVTISPNIKSRNRSASLGHVIVSMAHHKLRPSSGGASPDPRRSTVEKKPSEEVTRPQCTEYENGHHQPACVESLVKRCASCFDENGECVNGDFPRLLFLTHAWFMTSEQLVVLFSQLYEDENTPTTMKKQVFFAIRYWMKEFPHMFDLDAALVKAVNDLQILAAPDDQVDATLIDLSNRGNYRWMRPDRLSVRPPQGAGRKRRKVSLVFHHLEPEELAIHMSYLEFKCFRRLTFEDFHKYAMHATIKNIARLERSVFLFNNITLWVQCMVLGQHTPQERAAVITKYIKISQKLREMRNYNTLMAVVGGLTHTAIARLKKTMSALTKDSVKALDELVELLDSRSNYVAYRRDYAQQEGGFKLPVIGIHMKDIIGLHTAMMDRVGDGLINVKKMMSIGATFQELLNIQRTPFPHEVNKDLVNTLRVSLYLYYTEEEIYALSLQREPKDTKNSVSSAHSPSKINNMVFAEFTKFTCHLDNDTVTQHVTAMVESVFKAYDHDNDGFISEEEFDSFKDNFPMMESFSAMDVDRDGKISRSEMRDYFMKASAIRRNDFCQNFTHEFTETTYFHPTFCEECEKLLWGLVKQGWKCKGCGINCHKHCKDRIVQECRPKQSVANQQNNGQQANSTTSSSSTKRNRGHEKSSVSSESDLSANGDVLTAIVNSTPQNQALEDEAFDSPTELNSSIQRNVSPSIMRRSTSLASADVTPRSLLRQIQDSKTPPPTRKVNQSSPDHGSSGRRSFQRKMQKIIPRRNNSHKVRAMTDACTQTLPRSPTVLPSTPQFASTRSFLYPKAPETPKIFLANSERTHGERLGSTGEELDDTQTSHLNNNHVIPRVTKQEICDVTTAMRDTRIQGRHGSPRHHRSTDSFLLSSTPPNHMSQTNHDQRHSVARRDSGLSGCSTFTLCERSVPATPNTFRFPPSFTYEEVPAQNTSKSEFISDLQEENFRLRETNVQLEKQLVSTKDYVKLLEEKLIQNGLKLTNPVVSKT